MFSDATATFAAYPELATKVDDTAVADADLDELVGASYGNFVDACLVQTNECALGERAWTDAGVTARFGGAPATGWNANADNIVEGDGNSSAEGMSFWPSDAGTFNLAVRNGSTSLRGLMRFDQGAQLWSWWTNGVQRWGADNAAVYPIASMTFGTDANRWSAGYYSGSLYVADAPTTGFNASADDLVMGDGTGDVGLSAYSGATSLFRIAARDSGSSIAGFIQYAHNGDFWTFGTAATAKALLTGTYYAPNASGGLTLGTSSLPWGDVYAGSDIFLGDAGGLHRFIINADGANSGDIIFQHDGDTEWRLRSNGADDSLTFSHWAAGAFTANVLRMESDGGIVVGKSSGEVAFLGGTPTTKQTVTGSTGGNAALQNLLTALAAYGLITDSTT